MVAGAIQVLFPTAVPPDDYIYVGGVAVFDWWNTAKLGAQPSQATLDAVTQQQVDDYNAQTKSKVLGVTRTVRLQTTRTNSTTSYADCTGMSFQLAANVSYSFRFDGAYTTAVNTTGLQLALNGPAASFRAFGFEVAESATAWRVGMASTYDAGVNGTGSAGATLLPFHIFGNLTTTAAGLLVVRFRSEVAASAVNILQGSYGTLAPVE